VSDSVGTLLQQRRTASLVGREAELDALRSMLSGDAPIVAIVHGVAGIGKSTLLEAFLAEARAECRRQRGG